MEKKCLLLLLSSNSSEMIYADYVKLRKSEDELVLRVVYNVEGDCSLVNLDVKFGLLFSLVMVFGSDGERRSRFFRIISGDNVVSIDGRGYAYSKRRSNQEAHYAKTSSQVIFGIIFTYVKEGDSETEVVTHQEEQEPELMVIIWYYNTWKHCYNLASRNCNSEVLEAFNDDNQVFREKVVVWFSIVKFILKIMLFMVNYGVVFLLGWLIIFSGSLKCMCVGVLVFEGLKGMNFVSSMPVVEMFLRFSISNFKLPTFGLSYFCAFSYPPRWSNQIHFSHHRAPGSD
jgi:ABC-type multidrug transport system fused ATPase/permease subunit